MREKAVMTAFLVGVVCSCGSLKAAAQLPPREQQLPKEAAPLKEQALKLLDQLMVEAQALKLPENRIRLQLTAGDLLWEHDEERARSLFTGAAAGIAEMMHSIESSDRQYFNLIQTPAQLRRELLSVVAQHDPQLAYSLLLSTRQPSPPQNLPNFRRPDSESNLEMSLLAQIAAADPLLALKNAEEILAQGQFPASLARVMAQLQRKDKEAARKLTENLLQRLRVETLLANQEAGRLALNLLRPGPRRAEAHPQGEPQLETEESGQVLDEAAFRRLMESVIAAALSATPRTPGGQAAPGSPRGGTGRLRGGQSSQQGRPDNTQQYARNLLLGLQPLLPHIDRYLPARAGAVRQKLSEVGSNPRQAAFELSNLVQQGSVDAILEAAPKAGPGMASWLYLQAATKALAEGDFDRARQIATEHLDPRQRDTLLRQVERQQSLRTAMAGRIEELRQTLSRLPSDPERVNWLIQMAAAAQKNDQKLAWQLLEEAYSLASRRAENYQQLEAQLKLAQAMAELDPARAFELLERGIEQINELLLAAALLSGFELRIFKDGELPLQNGSMLSRIITRYGQELATLARKDFDRAQLAADKFQRPEARILARLSIVQGMLGKQTTAEAAGLPDRGFGPRFRPRQ